MTTTRHGVLVLPFLASAAWAQCGPSIGGLAMPIPDMGTASYSGSCGNQGTVGGISLAIRVLHPRQGDLIVRVIHNGVTVTVLDRPGTEDGQSTTGYTAANLGGNSWSVYFRDDAVSRYAVPPVGNVARPGIASVSGTFKPTVDPFSTFRGMPMAGDWTVEVVDAAPGLSGILDVVVLDVRAEGPCYANCDGSTTAPVLSANDFQCFLNAFAAGSSYANCDGTTSTPMLTAGDFQCFLNQYAAGCL